MNLSQNNHLKIAFSPDAKPFATIATSIGPRPQQKLNFKAECVRAAAEISSGASGEKIALLLDETFESAVAFLAFLNAGVPFETYFIEYANLDPAKKIAYSQVEQWARTFGIKVHRIAFDFNNPLHMEGLEKLQSSTSCTQIDQLFKIWAACNIDDFLIVPGFFVYPIFDPKLKLKQWNLPGYHQLGLLKFFEEFGGVPFFFGYSPSLVYSQVDSEVSNQLLAITEGENRKIVPGSLAVKKIFAEQTFSSELGKLKILDSGQRIQIRALRGCDRLIRERYLGLLKKMSGPAEPLVLQNIDFQPAAFESIIKERSYHAELMALSERSDFGGNFFEVESAEQCDHEAIAAFPTLVTSRVFKGDTPKIFDFVKTLDFFKNGGNTSTFVELHKHDQLAELIVFFKETIDLYFEEMGYEIDTLEITECWANRSKNDQHHKLHYHSNSLLSGVFYLTSGGGANTVFNSAHKPQLLPKTKKNKKLNLLSFETAPESGKLILFPSHLDHKTKPHTDPELARYSIAFNVMFKADS